MTADQREQDGSPTGPEGAELKVRLASPPVDGRANDELVRWLDPQRVEESDEQALGDASTYSRLQRVFPIDRPYNVVHRNLYQVHQRVAATFRKGRVFLAGDSAHRAGRDYLRILPQVTGRLRVHVGKLPLIGKELGLSYTEIGLIMTIQHLAGAILFMIGLAAGVTALVMRFGYGFGFRPLLNLVETMVISGIVLFGFGLLGEMIAGMQEETREMARTLARLDKLDVSPALRRLGELRDRQRRGRRREQRA